MEIFSCESHIEQALDDFIEKLEIFPIMEKVGEEKKLSTKCGYCNNVSIYVVANR